jgi:acylphosphatase
MTLVASVRGRVQNVGFRAFVVEVATRLRLRGYTRNCPDRTVEVVASGSRADLETLLGFLRQGPLAARVDSVEHEWSGHRQMGLSDRFEVRG